MTYYFKHLSLSLASILLFTAQAQTDITAESETTAPAKITLTFQSVYADGSTPYQMEKKWAESIYDKTNGEVAVEYHPVGFYTNAYETLDAIKLHVLDGHMSYLGYFSDQEPAYTLLGDMVGVFDKPEQLIGFFNSDEGRALLNDIHGDEVTYLGGFTKGFDSLVAKKKVSNVADMKDVTVRAPTGLVTKIMQAEGAKPVQATQSETAAALKSGLVEMADYSTLSINRESKLFDVAPYAIYPGFHSMIAFEVAVNSDEWKKISPTSQKAIQNSIDTLAKDMLATFRAQDQKALSAIRANSNIEVVSWTPDALKAFQEIALKTRQDIATASKNAKKVENALEAYAKTH